MDYPAALRYFRERSDYDRGFISNPFAGDDAALAGLRRTRLLLDALGQPDRAYPIIHVAGTKGKGSTCAFVESLARASGLCTGMFVTPHLHTVRERTRIDASAISESGFARLMLRTAEAVYDIERRHPHEGSLTAFEISTAMSLLACAEAPVDLAIVEVGLGGRLDATNVVEPAVSVITPISLDHQAILGDTLGEIAAEKAGILRPGVPAVIASQPASALAVIRDTAALIGAPLSLEGDAWHAQYRAGLATLSGPWGVLERIRLGLRGPHQADNAGAALMAIWHFRHNLLNDPSRARRALEATTWPGRFETIRDSPPVIVDGAHNVASMEMLATTLQEAHPGSRYIVVLGSYRDKDLAGMLASLTHLQPLIVATRSTSPRAREPAEIQAQSFALGMDSVIQPAVDAALRYALEQAGPDQVIVVTGSLSVAAEAREALGLGDVSPVEREIMSG
jgi:dihydrofolate synthase/folylpolyglutamate synthase